MIKSSKHQRENILTYTTDSFDSRGGRCSAEKNNSKYLQKLSNKMNRYKYC